MTTFPGSPQLRKGSLVTIDPVSGKRTVIEFQYNPETLTRRLDANAMGGEGGDKVEVYRLKGPPTETITLNVEIDATDQLEKGDKDTKKKGIYPVLSRLELLLYPSLAAVKDNADRADRGEIEIIPPEAPLTLFEWGGYRVLPVRLTGFSITEEAHDERLNPIRAKIDLTLRVLNYLDFRRDHAGYQAFLSHHQKKENLAGQPRSS
jgi:hypothetical protein